MKYKIKQYDGCMNGGMIEVNGQGLYGEYNIMSPEDRKQFEDYLFEKLRESYEASEISINEIVGLFQYDDYKDGGTCDQCFDSTSTTTWEL